MTKFPLRKDFKFPKTVNILLAILSATLLIAAFPGFEFFYLAWFALVPLFFAVEREKESWFASFVLGWIFGILFFFATCWWLTFAPITYAGFPAVLAYFLLFCVCLVVGLFPALFAALFSVLQKRFGAKAILSAPFLWTATEFLRFWLTGNNWNAIGYSQAFGSKAITFASIGGVPLVSFIIVLFNALFAASVIFYLRFEKLKPSRKRSIGFIIFTYLPLRYLVTSFKDPQMAKFARRYKPLDKVRLSYIALIFLFFISIFLFAVFSSTDSNLTTETEKTTIIAVQPNVPMSDLDETKWQTLRQRHLELAETAVERIKEQRTNDQGQKTIVIFPESPMNFMYGRDEEFREFIKVFTEKNNVSVLFNSAEPNQKGDQFYNSAVLVNEEGRKIFQYDKIHLLPFGEYLPLSELVGQIIPPMVGNFAFGDKYELVPLGNAKAGVMICFESHFPDLSNEFVRNGADALVEMTNDGYLGNTPVLRQHLANAVFRAVETHRPVLRVTNVGITARISENGEILDAADAYTEATRVWKIGKSNGERTFYVSFGDWFAWLCVIVSFGLLIISLKKSRKSV